MISEHYNKSSIEIVEDLGLCNAIYEGYIDCEGDLEYLHEEHLLTGDSFDDFRWLCKIFKVAV